MTTTEPAALPTPSGLGSDSAALRAANPEPKRVFNEEIFAPFPDKAAARRLIESMQHLVPPGRHWKIMHVCGSHEHTFARWGLRSVLPEGVEVIAGPGCPVCVCPAHEVAEAVEMCRRGAIVATFGDMIALPSPGGSLARAKAEGGDVQLIYSPADAIRLARERPDRDVVLFAVGFETTTAPVAAALASPNLPPNFSALVSHRLTPPAVELLLGIGDIHIDGFIAPGHVSVVTGIDVWRRFPEAYAMPVVVAGFEPEDALLGLVMLLKQLAAGEAKLENEYGRMVPDHGNPAAQAMVDKVFEITSAWWRGIGRLPRSGLKLRPEYAHLDAREKLGVRIDASPRDLPPGCSCHLVMLGKIDPPGCPLFGRTCTPADPHGPCMVSQEGTCNIWHTHRLGVPAVTP